MFQNIFRFPNQVDRVLSLDMCRFVTALLVLFFHILEGLKSVHAETFLGFGFLKPVANFFFLSFFWGSGYFIATTVLKEIQFTGSLNAKKYLIKRILRTWPLYFFLLFCFWISYRDNDVFMKHFLSFVMFIQNFSKPQFYAESWSIAVEEQFYLFFLVFSLIVRPKSWPLALAAGLLLSLAGRFLLGFRLAPYPNNHILLWIDGLLIGCLWAWFVHSRPKVLKSIEESPNIWSLIGILLYSVVMLKIEFFPYWNRTLLPLLSLMGIFPVVSKKHFFSFLFHRRIAVPLSNLTYSLYLAQGLYLKYVLLLFPILTEFVEIQWAVVGTMIAGLSIGLIISSLLFLMIEKPFYRLRSYLISQNDNALV